MKWLRLMLVTGIVVGAVAAVLFAYGSSLRVFLALRNSLAAHRTVIAHLIPVGDSSELLLVGRDNEKGTIFMSAMVDLESAEPSPESWARIRNQHDLQDLLRDPLTRPGFYQGKTGQLLLSWWHAIRGNYMLHLGVAPDVNPFAGRFARIGWADVPDERVVLYRTTVVARKGVVSSYYYPEADVIVGVGVTSGMPRVEMVRGTRRPEGTAPGWVRVFSSRSPAADTVLSRSEAADSRGAAYARLGTALRGIYQDLDRRFPVDAEQ